MKVVRPSRLLSAAAEVLAPVRDHVVVIGAAAIEVALAEAESAAITPTRDVDLVVAVDRAADVVAHLERADMSPSDLPYERGFTWVRGDLKVQLVRTFHPFPGPVAKAWPENPAVDIASKPAHQLMVAFAEDPTQPRLRCANAACMLALKHAAFGRTQPPDATPVERDFHDAYLLISAVPNTVVAELEVAEYGVRRRAVGAVSQLASGDHPTVAAARQMVHLGMASSQRQAEAAVKRAAVQVQRALDRIQP